MKIAITDTCIFIDLHELDLTPQLFQLPIQIHTSKVIVEELYPAQQALLNTYIAAATLHVHSLSVADVLAIHQLPLPAGLSFNDKSVLLLAQKTQAMVLSGDALIRRTAGRLGIEYHGMLWLFDQLVEHAVLSESEAAEKLHQLRLINSYYQSNARLHLEIEKRLKTWSA